MINCRSLSGCLLMQQQFASSHFCIASHVAVLVLLLRGQFICPLYVQTIMSLSADLRIDESPIFGAWTFFNSLPHMEVGERPSGFWINWRVSFSIEEEEEEYFL
ncbi:hypothetical protein AVEN_100736-1 [Araneus ventricosus]|uniref:Uncharacterized protein n=1 Tax=Araneus ventricosus TaxID=182803 RepID=A0A4Y2CSV6_ARAVE|nr:hypothetical protein AVEN_100736-1 [Araneus ventricosus]